MITYCTYPVKSGDETDSTKQMVKLVTVEGIGGQSMDKQNYSIAFSHEKEGPAADKSLMINEV